MRSERASPPPFSLRVYPPPLKPAEKRAKREREGERAREGQPLTAAAGAASSPALKNRFPLNHHPPRFFFPHLFNTPFPLFSTDFQLPKGFPLASEVMKEYSAIAHTTVGDPTK